jgi:hypothetical protein
MEKASGPPRLLEQRWSEAFPAMHHGVPLSGQHTEFFAIVDGQSGRPDDEDVVRDNPPLKANFYWGSYLGNIN